MREEAKGRRKLNSDELQATYSNTIRIIKLAGHTEWVGGKNKCMQNFGWKAS
jgi:hypothetical protein